MFQSILAKLVAQAGARWAMIVGNDGVLLETDCPSFRKPAEGMAAEYAVLCCASRKTSGNTDLGGLRQTLMVTDQGKIVFQTLTDDYFLVLLLKPESYAGKAFYEISRVMKPLEKELSY